MPHVIIQARLGSKRFPNKVLSKIDQKPLLLYQIHRLKKSKLINKIIVATTKKDEDKKIVDLCKKNSITYYVGSENNVLKRYYDCSKKNKSKIIIRLTSDCPLVDTELIDKMVKKFKKYNVDYLSNTTPPKTSKWPDGSDVEIFSFNALEKAYKECKNPTFKEHVTFYFWKGKNKSKFHIKQMKNKENFSRFRYTVDYKEDLIVVRKLNQMLTKRRQQGTVTEICNILEKNNNIFKINSKYYFGIGWKQNK